MSAPDRYAVIGHPIAHSQSPRIHRLFAQQCQQLMSYGAVDVTPEQLLPWVSNFFATAGCGLNLTVPHKQSLLQIPERLSDRARIAGALNTLALDPQGRLIADNTDGLGLVRDLTHNLHLTITAHRILLLGAGGAARGVLAPLLELQPAQLVIANRSSERAQGLVEAFAQYGPVRASSYPQLQGTEFDLIINATAAGLDAQLPPLPISVLTARSTVCYDMSYGEKDTPFTRWAQQHGVRSHMGLGMLIEQAAESFYLWRGLRPDTSGVRAALGFAGN